MKHKRLVQIFVMVSMLFSTSLFAMSLEEAKLKGLVGEKSNGYLGIVAKQQSVKDLVDDINAKRKGVYTKLAAKNKITLQQVEKLAAEKAYKKTRSGHYIWVNNAWAKK